MLSAKCCSSMTILGLMYQQERIGTSTHIMTTPAYSRDMVRSDSHLFPTLKERLGGKQVANGVELKQTVTGSNIWQQMGPTTLLKNLSHGTKDFFTTMVIEFQLIILTKT